MEIRRVTPAQYETLADITVRAYRALYGGRELGPYEDQLRNVAARDHDSEVYVALDDRGEVVGGATLVPGPEREMAEFHDPGAAGVRMLAVDPDRPRTGAGRALMVTCVARARKLDRRRIILHSTAAMTNAHALYASLGFVRAPELDEYVDQSHDGGAPLHLMAFTLEL